MQKIVATIEKITPDRALKMLKFSNGNRSISTRFLQRYRRDMEAGNWSLNGEPIIISTEGFLLDGQHRLMACAESGKEFETLVVRGVEADAFVSMGTGKPRSTQDILSIEGEKTTFVLAATVNLLVKYQQETILDNTQVASNAEKLSFLKEHPAIRESVRFATSTRGPLPKTICAALHFLGSYSDADVTTGFLKQVQSGEDLSRGDPALCLRNLVLPTQSRYGRISTRINRTMLVALSIKALNAQLQGRRVFLLKWLKNEPFPSVYMAPPSLFERGNPQ